VEEEMEECLNNTDDSIGRIRVKEKHLLENESQHQCSDGTGMGCMDRWDMMCSVSLVLFANQFPAGQVSKLNRPGQVNMKFNI
jgi:hypothetical protein